MACYAMAVKKNILGGKSMKKIALIAIAAVCAIGLMNCSSAKVLTNPNAKFPIPASDATPAFLFPINMAHLGVSGGDVNLMGASVTAGVIGKFGKSVVSGQQLFDLVGNLSWELAETIDSQARAGKWKMTGSAEKVASDLSAKMSVILATLADLKLIPASFKFKYIIAVHTHGQKAMLPKTLDINSWGGIYDVDTKEILSYINTTGTVADDDKAIIAQLPGIYNDLISQVLAGKAK